MDPEVTHCLSHMIIVQNAVQCLLNAAAFLIGPMKYQYLPTFVPIGLLTTTFSIYSISKPRPKLLIWYIIFLLIGFFYRIYVIVDMFIYRNQLTKIIKNCDDYDLIDIEGNSQCNLRLDFKVTALNLMNAVAFHFVSIILDIFLIIISIQLRFTWKHFDQEQRLLLLTVQYDKNSRVINKYLKDKYGTFRVLAENGKLNDEIDFLKGNLLKANYFDSFESTFENSFQKNSQSDFYETADSENDQEILRIPKFNSTPTQNAKDIYEKFLKSNEIVNDQNVETNDQINDQIMENIMKKVVN